MLKNKVRIIAGKYRRRTISFSDNEELRPTPDRVREAVFNWLQSYLDGSVCLDAFAGSGILGFEALSRGASCVYFTDQMPENIEHIRENAKALNIKDLQAYTCKLPGGLSMLKEAPPFDIVFLDPPYGSKLIEPTLSQLIKTDHIKEDGLIYVEESVQNASTLNSNEFEPIKEKNTKTILYRLFRYTKNNCARHPGFQPPARSAQ